MQIYQDAIPKIKNHLKQIFQLLASGTNLKAIKRRLPAPAIAANIRPKSVGIVFEAKTIDEIPTPMI